MRIAYVEDNPTNLALVERVASMNRHVIVSYTEGEIALQELKRETYDLILMDIELAGDMGGLDVVRKLRAYGLETPIIAVTAYAMMGDRDKCIDAGCTDYLSKPLPIPQLIALLNRYEEITKHAAAAPVAAPPVAAGIENQPETVPPVATSTAPTLPPVAPASPETQHEAVPSSEPVVVAKDSVPVETPAVKPEPAAEKAQQDEFKP
jgi:CheY-like chemotaxis protein